MKKDELLEWLLSMRQEELIDTEREFTVTEYMGVFGCSRNAAKKQLKKLVTDGVLNVRDIRRPTRRLAYSYKEKKRG